MTVTEKSSPVRFGSQNNRETKRSHPGRGADIERVTGRIFGHFRASDELREQFLTAHQRAS